MARELPRTPFNRSTLVRVLAGLAVADVPESNQPFAERLGQWLDFKDALSLSSVLGANAAGAADVQCSAESAALWKACTRVRHALVESITRDGVLKPAAAPANLSAASRAAMECAADFAPYQQYYLARQRDMTANIASLRATVRATLAKQSPSLKRLAALDAVLDKAMAAREGSLLATVPGLLAKRFEQLFKAQQATQLEAQTADDPERWLQPGGWLAAFCEEMQAVLLAELDLRLQPVKGLIAALDNEVLTDNG